MSINKRYVRVWWSFNLFWTCVAHFAQMQAQRINSIWQRRIIYIRLRDKSSSYRVLCAMAGLGNEARIIILLVIDVIFFFIEIISGYAVGSLALVADSFHMLNDVMSLIVALYAVQLLSLIHI